MLSLVLRIAIALVLCSQVLTLRQDSVHKRPREGKYVEFLQDEAKLEATSSLNHYGRSSRSKSESESGNYKDDDANNDYLKRKSYEEQDDDDNERFDGGIKDPNGILPEFSIPIGNVSATLGRDARLICTVEQLGQYQVSFYLSPSLSLSSFIVVYF